MPWPPKSCSRLFARPIDRELTRLWRLTLDRFEYVVIALGILLRLLTYWEDREFWLDELFLWGNIAGTPILEFSQPLAGDQLAPVGFLITERAVVRLLGQSTRVGRIVPLVCGIA